MSVAICFVASCEPSLSKRHLGLLDHRRDAIAPELERKLQIGLCVRELVGRVETLDPLQKVLAGPAARTQLRLELEGTRVAGVAEPQEELVGELGRGGDERLEVAQVVLERSLLARIEAAANREEQQHDHTDADHEGKRAPLEDVTGWLPRGRGATAAGGRRLAASPRRAPIVGFRGFHSGGSITACAPGGVRPLTQRSHSGAAQALAPRLSSSLRRGPCRRELRTPRSWPRRRSRASSPPCRLRRTGRRSPPCRRACPCRRPR